MPCFKFWPVEEKHAYVDSSHLNNSDKVSIIIYGADKLHIIFINQLSVWLKTCLYLKAEMTFLWKVVKALLKHSHYLFEHAIKLFSV